MIHRETDMMERANWRGDHSVPSEGPHYRYMWKWDSLKAVVINARRGKPDRAKTELLTLEKYRDPQTGFVSNKIFATTRHKTWRDYPEAWNFNNNKVGSSYTQPPIEAWSAIETFTSFVNQERRSDGIQFLKDIYGSATPDNYTGLQGEYAYFMNHRQNSDDNPLIGIVHPNETGRDSDEANHPWVIKSDEHKGKKIKHTWLHMQRLGIQVGRLGRDPQGKRIDWIPKQVRGKYWVNDVMFNAMYASNLRYTSQIGEILAAETTSSQEKKRYKTDSNKYQELADNVEKRILEDMWDEENGFFYNLDKDGKQIPVDSLTGLFPLLLDKITQKQTATLLDKLEDPEWFHTTYPIPTHATRSEFYDPEPGKLKERLTPPWSGPVWISTNQILVEEGLVRQAERFLNPESPDYDPGLGERCMRNAGRIAEQTKKLLAINPTTRECYTTEGKGLRVDVFMWTNLGLHFEKYEAAKKKFALAA
jgi:hypothetical protein